MAVKIVYIDDSGAQDTGWITYSWVMVDITDWTTGLDTWLRWRHTLAGKSGIPKLYELHATAFLGGRQTPAVDPAVTIPKAGRAKIVEEALGVVAGTRCLSVGTVHRLTSARRRAYGAERAAVYRELLVLLQARLDAAGDHAIIVMDGDGTDLTYQRAHRELPLQGRLIVEDPIFQHSHVSQWVQIADLVAWTAYKHLLADRRRDGAQGWYARHLLARDMLGGPTAV